MSVYLPKGPIGDNTDWVKSIANNTKSIIIVGDFNAHSPLWDNECKHVNSKRFQENIVDSEMCLLNDGSITRIPDVSTHRPSAIDLSLVSPDLAVNTLWYVCEDTLGSDHLPIIIQLDEKIDYINSITEEKVPKFNYKFAKWDIFQFNLMESNVEDIPNVDINIYFSNFRNLILAAAEKSNSRI